MLWQAQLPPCTANARPMPTLFEKLLNPYEPKCQLDRCLAMDHAPQDAILDHHFLNLLWR
jgi:hypothetical protein